MSEYFETLRGLITPSDCDENAVMTSSALSACMADATAHALHTLGLGPRQMRQGRERVRLIHEHLDRQFDLGPGDIFHVESTLLSTDQETHILQHRMIDSAGGAISCMARTEVTAPPLPQTDTAEPADQVGVETYRGRVSSAQCDQMRHMNVQYYMEKNSQALAQIGNMLGLGKGFYPQTERILFERELYAGDVLVMRSGIRKVEDDRVHVASLLLNGENGDVAARFETVARLWNPTDGTLQPLTGGVRKLALSFAPATEDDFPPPRPITGPRASADVPPNTVVTCRRAVNTWETDATALATPGFAISCVSDAAMHLFTHMGVDHAWRTENDTGSAALDYHIRYHRPMAIGTPVEAHSRFLETREKVFRFSHHLCDATDGTLTTTIEVTAVLFDLSKRKSIPLPQNFHQMALNFGAVKEPMEP